LLDKINIHTVKTLLSVIETFEKCSILFKFKSKTPDFERGKAEILTTPYDLPDLRGRHEYIEYFED
jgi:hypothetical protein